MKKVSPNSREVKSIKQVDFASTPVFEEELNALDIRIELIQALIPLGLEAVAEELQNEVTRLAGEKNSRKGSKTSNRRWGSQQGSVYLSDQKVPISVPRVRDVEAKVEVPLDVYHRFQSPRGMDEGLLLRMLKGIATRSYEACAETVPEAFGLSSSTVSKRFIKASAAKLRQFQERSLKGYDLVALFRDGKTFADQEMIIALGVTLEGDKIPLGFVQAATENERVCRQFIDSLIQRGLQYHQGLLCLIDGSKGLYNALTKALAGYVAIQRCQWHKRENVIAYLPKGEQEEMKKALQDAYDRETYQEAKAALKALKPALSLMNESALNSLEEGLEETLTLHRLGLMPQLKLSFRTTNCIESLNSMVAQLTRNVKRWKNSNQRNRWLATALLDIEPRLRRIKGFRLLPLLRRAIQSELKLEPEVQDAFAAD
ncbi:MAG: transposase [Arenicellales bacterium]|jgi:transposase-like protein|nr:transposase [Kiritimatiellia bacterium]MDP6725506.1 transposase [Arenicellales bacterium]|tara:strand:- start:39 stop:1325 length:1287 start_codon:yes stop_codon:yes gene_type:complete